MFLQHFVTPSSVWPADEEEKARIIAGYRAKLAQIDCKYFDHGEGSCPFGTSCFYRCAGANIIVLCAAVHSEHVQKRNYDQSAACCQHARHAVVQQQPETPLWSLAGMCIRMVGSGSPSSASCTARATMTSRRCRSCSPCA